ncbi:MOSC domain-containing protein [Rubellimicrobium arenae]|uniref:MOSC domain-containing protein n=1 Tax=Rubellimicrobium arenae TaxID=2817372 RepID=UPI001B313D3E|nr:MOSC domain-containing protein [Rubellimicrobium arenae]
MPALVPSDHYGTVVWLGRVARPVGPDLIIHGEPLTEMLLGFAGFVGEVHAGLTRPSCSRVTMQYPKGTEIRNTRQVSLVGAEELAHIAAELGLEAVDPAWLGASVVIDGIPDFTHVPPSSRLQGEGGATLVVDMENHPCVEPAKTIELARPGHGKAFRAAAKGRRGITAWVEREGILRLGERVRLHVPSQRGWEPQGRVQETR